MAKKVLDGKYGGYQSATEEASAKAKLEYQAIKKVVQPIAAHISAAGPSNDKKRFTPLWSLPSGWAAGGGSAQGKVLISKYGDLYWRRNLEEIKLRTLKQRNYRHTIVGSSLYAYITQHKLALPTEGLSEIDGMEAGVRDAEYRAYAHSPIHVQIVDEFGFPKH